MVSFLKSYLPILFLVIVNTLVAPVNLGASTIMVTPPSNLVATASSSSAIDLTWMDNSIDEMAFEIEMSTEETTGFFKIGEVEADIIIFTASNLAAHSTTYYFRVVPKGTTDYSNTASAATLAPEAPTNLATGTVTAVSVVLTWDDNTNFEIGYRIERKKEGEMDFSLIGEVGEDVTTFTSQGLTGSTSYEYRVAGKLGVQESDITDYSNIVMVTTSAPVVPNGVPNGLTATVLSETEIRINWSDQSTNETGFTILRSDFIEGFYQEVGEVATDVTSFTETDLQPGSKYFFKVRAFNDEGATDNSSSVSATTNVAAPEAPTGLEAVDVGPDAISIIWNDNSSRETGYRVEIANGSQFSAVGTLEPDIEEYTITDLMEVTLYSIKVIAFNDTGETSSAVIKQATTQVPPDAPTDLKFTINADGTELTLEWTDNSTNEEGFLIERSDGDVENFAELDNVEPDITSFTDQIEEGVNFFYRVKAFNEGGDSEYTNITGNVLTALGNESSNLNLSVYPNPSNGLVNIQFDALMSDLKEVLIYDTVGRMVSNPKVTLNGDRITLDLTGQPQGLYLIKLRIGGPR